MMSRSLVTVLLALSCTTGCGSAEAGSSAADANEEVARAYMQAYNDRDMDGLRRVLAEELDLAGKTYARDDYLSMVETHYWSAFPDMRFVGEPVVVGAEEHVTVYTEFEATGSGEFAGEDVEGKKARATEIMLFGIQDGRIHEYRYNWDELGFLVQLGVLESPYATE